MAQVTISGAVGFGYTKDSAAKGMRMTDGALTVTATEDLGNGMKVTASGTIDNALSGRGVGKDVANANSTVTMSMGGFSIMGGSFESTADARRGDISGVSAEQGKDQSDLNLASGNVDGVVLTYNVGNGLTLGASVAEMEIGTAAGIYSATQALGDSTNNTRSTKFTATYAAGPILDHGATAKVSGTNIASSATSKQKTSNSVAASYNFGVAQVGVGFRSDNGTDSVSLYSVKVPMGAFSLGAARAEYNDKRNTVYGVNYSFSKTTTLFVSKSTSNVTALDSSTRVKLVKAF
jgi:hypothetical protein